MALDFSTYLNSMLLARTPEAKQQELVVEDIVEDRRVARKLDKAAAARSIADDIRREKASDNPDSKVLQTYYELLDDLKPSK